MAEGGHPRITLDVLLLGKTGQGKSTTGNKLINADGGDGRRQVNRDELKVVWPLENETNSHQPAADGDIPKFKAGAGAQSVSDGCRVITNLETRYRVMDTQGFAPSNSRIAAVQANLGIIREVVGVSTDIQLAYHRVLYFLPYRHIPERADGHWQDELAVLWHYFGEDVFKNMVIVLTTRARRVTADSTPNNSQATCTANIDAVFDEGAEEELREVFEEALRGAISRREEAALPAFPPTIFIPSNATANDVAKIIRNVKVQEHEGINLRFRTSTCCRCSSVIRGRYYEGSTAKATPIEVDEKLVAEEKSACHPAIVPKHSRVEKFAGGMLHIITLGIPAAVQRVSNRPMKLWPWFTNSEMQCVQCKESPAMKGCIEVGKEYDGIVVQHDAKMMDIIVVDQKL